MEFPACVYLTMSEERSGNVKFIVVRNVDKLESLYDGYICETITKYASTTRKSIGAGSIKQNFSVVREK